MVTMSQLTARKSRRAVRRCLPALRRHVSLTYMSTLTEIEAAVELLAPADKQELLRYLERHVSEPAPGRRALPLVPATGQRITQQEIDDALEAD